MAETNLHREKGNHNNDNDCLEKVMINYVTYQLTSGMMMMMSRILCQHEGHEWKLHGHFMKNMSFQSRKVYWRNVMRHDHRVCFIISNDNTTCFAHQSHSF